MEDQLDIGKECKEFSYDFQFYIQCIVYDVRCKGEMNAALPLIPDFKTFNFQLNF